MTYLLGIDLGTSSVKAVIVNERAEVLGVGAHEYPILIPQPGYAEQAPEDWWQAAIQAVRGAVGQVGSDYIASIGLCGQMHGTVLIGPDQRPVGDAIIWPDQRTTTQVDAMIAKFGKTYLARTVGTAPAAGFAAVTLPWLLEHDPARLDRTAFSILPKDYVRLRLTGEVATDASDAAATALFNVYERRWDSGIVAGLGLPERILPPIRDSAALGGRLRPEAAEALGLLAGIPVAVGCADQPAQAIGNGLIDPGTGSITIGTGGQVFASQAVPRADPELRLHTFCHAPADRWYVLGAMLSAGLSLRWFRDLLGLQGSPDAYDQLSALAAQVPPGAQGLLFQPYLVGERSPLMDSQARGTFVGLTLQHGRGHLARAIMEGVAFAIRQIVTLMVALDTPVDGFLASGGGLASPIWRQLMADVLDRPLWLRGGREKAGVGAALLGGIAAGIFPDYEALKPITGGTTLITEPDQQRARFYAERYEHFLSLYPLLRSTFHDLT